MGCSERLYPVFLGEHLEGNAELSAGELAFALIPRICSLGDLGKGRCPLLADNPMDGCQQFQAEGRLESLDKRRHPVNVAGRLGRIREKGACILERTGYQF